METLFFLLDLVLVAAAGVAAIVVGRTAASGRAAGLLAAGSYWALLAVVLAVVPVVAWERARTDNAFLGVYPITLVMLVLGIVSILFARARLVASAPGWRRLVALPIVGVVGALAAWEVLLARGPQAWQTGSGQFGLDVIAADVVLAAIVFAVATWTGRPSPGRS